MSETPPPLVKEDRVHRKFTAPRPRNGGRSTDPSGDGSPLIVSDCKSVIVCAAIDVDRLSGDEASILTD